MIKNLKTMIVFNKINFKTKIKILKILKNISITLIMPKS